MRTCGEHPDATLGEVGAAFTRTRQATSYQVQRLARLGAVEVAVEGKYRRVRAAPLVAWAP